jgi:hypothetical protein
MIPVPSGVRVWLATGVTDMRRGMNGLSLQVQEAFCRDPHAGDLYVFRKHSVSAAEAAGSRRALLLGSERDGVGRPVPRQELVEVAGLVIVDAGEHVTEPSLRIDLVEPCCLDQGVHECGAVAAAV